MSVEGYILGPTRLHIPRPYEGRPSDEPGFGPAPTSLCDRAQGGVYSQRFVDFHYADSPVCRVCIRSSHSQASPDA